MDFLSVKLVIILVLGYILFGGIVFHYIEQRSWVDSFYFATATISTVGFGDLTPHTDAGKIFTIFYILLGVSIAAYGFSVVGGYVIKYHLENHFENKVKKLVQESKAIVKSKVKK
ncbi:Calcium-gated potassium channel MthK [uncultured archaeon]|nr:Calcium-gated potassium channel MthK [uncultured archaeon]